MKTKLILILGLMALSACASGPTKKLYKNCEEAGHNSGLFYCEEIPEKEVGKK